VLVRVPLEFDVPLADGSRVLYALFGFVELKNGHAVAFVRIGPADFISYDDLDHARVARPVPQGLGLMS
jgi:hypothetical protein